MAAKKKIKPKTEIPSWFNPSSKPNLRWYPKPEKMIQPDDEISRVSIEEGEELILNPGSKYRLSFNHDINYGSCYYSSDTPSVTVRVDLIEYSDELVPNPNYKQELKNYELGLERIEAWDFLKIAWDEEQKELLEKEERKQLLKLKKKYEKT